MSSDQIGVSHTRKPRLVITGYSIDLLWSSVQSLAVFADRQPPKAMKERQGVAHHRGILCLASLRCSLFVQKALCAFINQRQNFL
jgi:hypothetical protein